MGLNTTDNSERTWLVTGASRGFGRALSETVLAQGERLVATARDPESFAREHPDALALPLDVPTPTRHPRRSSRPSRGSAGSTWW